MLKFVKKNKLIILGILIIIFLSLFFGLLLVNIHKKSYQELLEQHQSEKLIHIENAFIRHASSNNNKLLTAERFANIIFQNDKLLTERENDTLFIKAISVENKIHEKFKITELLYDNEPLRLNIKVLEGITYASNAFISVWQKTDHGFVRVISTEPDNANNSVSIFLNDSSDLIEKIMSGKKPILKVITEFDSKMIKSIPIYINGSVRAFLQISINESQASVYNKILLKKTEDIIIFNEAGKIIFKTDFTENELLNYKDLENIKFKKSKYNKASIKNNILHYSYIPVRQVYVGYVIPNDILIKGTKKDIIKIRMLVIIIGLIISGLLLIFYKRNNNKKNKIINEIENILYDKKETEINKDEKKNLKSIVQDLNKYDEDIRNYAVDLSKNILNNKFNYLRNNNKTAIALSKIQEKILSVAEHEQKRKTEEELRLKLNEGSAEITALLQHVTDLNELSFNIIKNTAEFLDIQQGGMFILDNTNPNQPVLEMIASYAYDKKRYTGKNIPVNEGLIGRAYFEKESIYMTELPNNYTLIESGFGGKEPKSLLIVPLIFNNEVQAVIELASIHEIEEYKIKFIEDIGENIASTISNLKHSIQTEELLTQTRLQSKEIEEQRKTLEEKINTHRRQNRKLDKEMLQLIEIIESIKAVTYMVEYDLKGTIIDISRIMLNSLGAKKEDIITKHHSNFVSDENYKENYKSFWTDISDNKTQILEEKIIFKDKEIKLSQSYVPIRNVRRKIYRILSIGTIIK
ncbi:MAG: GAF domain-containing protein [Bacteroidales bacterium]|nr:GAF domain-containing protein [Bacteroidales bacterium]